MSAIGLASVGLGCLLLVVAMGAYVVAWRSRRVIEPAPHAPNNYPAPVLRQQQPPPPLAPSLPPTTRPPATWAPLGAAGSNGASAPNVTVAQLEVRGSQHHVDSIASTMVAVLVDRGFVNVGGSQTGPTTYRRGSEMVTLQRTQGAVQARLDALPTTRGELTRAARAASLALGVRPIAVTDEAATYADALGHLVTVRSPQPGATP